MSTAKLSLEHGNRYPYDAKAGAIPYDWAHRAARGCIADLLDRNVINNALKDIDDTTRAEIVKTLAEIIRMAKP